MSIRAPRRTETQPLLPLPVAAFPAPLARSGRAGGRRSSSPGRATVQGTRAPRASEASGKATGVGAVPKAVRRAVAARDRAGVEVDAIEVAPFAREIWGEGFREIATTIAALVVLGLVWVGFEAGQVNAALAQAERTRSISLLAQSGPALRLASGYAGEARAR